MSSEKKAILLFTQCPANDITNSSLPAIAKFIAKGTMLTNVKKHNNYKEMAAAGAEHGEFIWDAALRSGAIVGSLQEKFDLCVLDIATNPSEIDQSLAEIIELAERNYLVVLVANGLIIFYGTGISKDHILEKEFCPCTVAPTISYICNLPVPQNCEAAICYAALKDIDLKMKEVKKLHATIESIEASLEKKSRQPWDKHDCA